MLTYEINIICDGDNCDDLITTEPVSSEDAAGEIESTIENEGWIEKDDKHYCEECAVKLKLK